MNETTSVWCNCPSRWLRVSSILQAETAQKLVSKLNPGLGNKYEKAKMLRDIQSAKNVTTVTGNSA